MQITVIIIVGSMFSRKAGFKKYIGKGTKFNFSFWKFLFICLSSTTGLKSAFLNAENKKSVLVISLIGLAAKRLKPEYKAVQYNIIGSG